MAFASWDHSSQTCSAEIKSQASQHLRLGDAQPSRDGPSTCKQVPSMHGGSSSSDSTVLLTTSPSGSASVWQEPSGGQWSCGGGERTSNDFLHSDHVNTPLTPWTEQPSPSLLQLLIPWSYLEGDGISSAKLILFQNVKSGISFHYVTRISETAIHTHILCSMCIVNALLGQGRKHLNLG